MVISVLGDQDKQVAPDKIELLETKTKEFIWESGDLALELLVCINHIPIIANTQQSEILLFTKSVLSIVM